MTIRDIAIAFGYEVNKSSEASVKKSINTLKSYATKALGAIGIGVSLTQLNAIIEEFQAVNQQIKYATNNIANQEDLQNAVNKAANATRMTYAAMATTVTDLMNTHNKLFKTVEDTAAFAELANKAFKSAGANESEISSLNSAIQNAFTTGKVSAGNFQNIMKSCPKVVTYLAKSLNLTEQQVKALGTAGAITANQLYTAFNASSSSIEKDYEQLAFTVSDALKYIRNNFGLWLVQMNEQYQITQRLAKFMTRAFDNVMSIVKKLTAWVERLSKRVGGIGNLLKIILITIGSIAAAIKAVPLVTSILAGNTALQQLAGTLGTTAAGSTAAFAGFKGLGSAIGKVAAAAGKACPWILLIIAIIAALMVSIEDLVAFFKGESSVAEGFFGAMGKSAEDMKNKIGAIVEKLGSIFSSVFSVVAQVIGLAAEIISGALVGAIVLLTEVLDPVLDMLKMVMDKIMPVINKLMQTLFNILEKLLNGVLKVLMSVIEMIVPILDLLIAVLEPLLDIIVMIIDAVLPILDILGPIIDIILEVVNLALQPCIEIIKMLCNLLNSVLTPVLNMVKQLLEPLMGIIKSILSVLTPILECLSQLLSAILSPIIEVLNVIIQILSGALGGALSFILKCIQPVIDGLGWLLGAFEKLINFLTGGLQKGVNAVGNFAKNISSKLVGMVKNLGSNIVNGISEGFSAAWNGLKNAVTGIFDKVVGWFKSLFGIHSPSTVFAEFGGMMMQGLANGLKNALSFVMDAISAIGGKILDAVKGLWEGVKNIAGKIGDAVSNAASTVAGWASSAWDGVKNGAKNAWTAVSNGFTSMASKVGDALSNTASKVKDFASGVAEKVSTGLSNAVSGIKNAVSGTVSKAVSAIKDSAVGKAVSSAVSTAKNAVSNAVSAAKTAVSNVASSVGAKVSEVVSNVKSTVSSVVSNAKSAVSSAVNAVKESSVGKAVSGAVGKAKSAVSSGLKKIGSWFGLANGGYIGANKPTPVVIGDNKSEGEIVSPISKMKATVIDALSTFAYAKTPTQSAQTLNNETSNRTFTQNVNITNQFNGGPAQAQKDGAKAMSKSSKDATGELARAFSYAR